MREFNCNQLKNIQVPEGWIENALNAPDKRKKFVVPIRFYHFAAGTAACLVLAAAVTFSLQFGINKNVKLTNPNRHSSSVVEQTTGDSYAADITSGSSPKGDLPLIFGEDNESSTIVTEPAETDAEGNTVSNPKSKQKSTTPTSGKTKNNSQKSSNPVPSDTKYDEPGEGDTQSETMRESTKVEEDPYEEPTMLESNTKEPIPEEPWQPGVCSFSTFADTSLAQGTVYCRVENQNGVVLGSGGLYDSSRSTEKLNTVYEDTKLLIYYCPFTIDYGTTCTVIFYNSNGAVIKQSTLTIYEQENYEIY